jgi:hypothetical protein
VILPCTAVCRLFQPRPTGAADFQARGETSKDDVGRSKPDPDVVEAALATLGIPPTEVVMIGDTPYDIEAAARAGVSTIALRSGGGWSDRELAGAAAIYDDPTDLLTHLDTSPISAQPPGTPAPAHHRGEVGEVATPRAARSAPRTKWRLAVPLRAPT